MLRWPADEAFRMGKEGTIENGLAFGDELSSLTIMDGCRCQQGQPGMMVLVVVPGEEVLAEAAGILNGTEAVRVTGPVLHGFEVRFRERVVVRNMRPAVRLDHSEIGQQQGQ